MPGKALFFLAGGVGISAGAPFTTFHYPIITSGVPPVIANGRLAQLGDAVQSIIAPGLTASDTFVLGEGAQDFVGGDRSVLFGKNIKQNNGGAGQAVDQVLIGNNIIVPAAATASSDFIGIGHTFSFVVPGGFNSYSATVAIGAVLTLNNTNASPAVNNVIVGGYAICTGANNVVIGNMARADSDESVAVGKAARATSLSTAIGNQATTSGGTGTKDIAIGRLAVANGGFSIAIGSDAQITVDSSIAIGAGARCTGTGSIAFGRNATNTLNNCILIGDAAHPIPQMRLEGATSAAVVGIGLCVTTQGGVTGRNSLGTADVPMIILNASDQIALGDATHRVQFSGADGAAAAVAVFTNAPTANAVRYIPAVFGAALGWIPFIPA